MRRLCVITLLALSLLLSGCRQRPVVLGIVPAPGIENLSAAVAPLAQALAGALKREVTPRVYMSYGQLIQGLADGQCDTAVLSPFAYVTAHDGSGTEAILRGVHGTATELRYAFITRPDTGITLPAGLAGKRIAVPAASGSPEYRCLKSFLLRFGIADQPRAVADDQGAVDALLGRSADVVAVSSDSLARLRAAAPDFDSGIVVVAITEPIAFEAVAVSARPGAPAAELQQAWQGIAGQTAFQNVLHSLYGFDGLITAGDGDYAPARETVQRLAIKIR